VPTALERVSSGISFGDGELVCLGFFPQAAFVEGEVSLVGDVLRVMSRPTQQRDRSVSNNCSVSQQSLSGLMETTVDAVAQEGLLSSKWLFTKLRLVLCYFFPK